jgi:hypothetical protein
MSHFRYIVDFKIGSYSNCKYKSFVLNVIKSIKSIRSYNVLFWSYFPLFITIFLFFKEKQEGFSLLSGLGSIGTTNILRLFCHAEARSIWLLSNFWILPWSEWQSCVVWVYFTLLLRLCSHSERRISVCLQFVMILLQSEWQSMITNYYCNCICSHFENQNLTNRLTLCIFYTMNDNFITEYFGIGIKMVKPLRI